MMKTGNCEILENNSFIISTLSLSLSPHSLSLNLKLEFRETFAACFVVDHDLMCFSFINIISFVLLLTCLIMFIIIQKKKREGGGGSQLLQIKCYIIQITVVSSFLCTRNIKRQITVSFLYTRNIKRQKITVSFLLYTRNIYQKVNNVSSSRSHYQFHITLPTTTTCRTIITVVVFIQFRLQIIIKLLLPHLDCRYMRIVTTTTLILENQKQTTFN